MKFAGCIAAERVGLPHAAVRVTAWRPWFHPLIGEPLNRLREGVGLPADPNLTMLSRPDNRTPEAIRNAVRDVSGDPGYRQSAQRLRDEMEHLPGPEPAVGWLERLAREQHPLLSSPGVTSPVPSPRA